VNYHVVTAHHAENKAAADVLLYRARHWCQLMKGLALAGMAKKANPSFLSEETYQSPFFRDWVVWLPHLMGSWRVLLLPH
jgi:hypothetical protein